MPFRHGYALFGRPLDLAPLGITQLLILGINFCKTSSSPAFQLRGVQSELIERECMLCDKLLQSENFLSSYAILVHKPLHFFYAWGVPPGEHYSKRLNHGQERSCRAEVQSKKKYIQQIVYEPVLVSS